MSQVRPGMRQPEAGKDVSIMSFFNALVSRVMRISLLHGN
jgi:hypothetical protein